MCSPNPPAAPDYVGAATAQGSANVDAARATAKLNNPNVIGPGGTSTVSYGTGGPSFDEAGYNAALTKYQTDSASPPWSANFGGQTFAQGPAPVAPNRDAFMRPGGDPDVPTVTQTLSPANQSIYDQSTKAKGLLAGVGVQGAEALGGVVGKPVDFSGAPQTQDYGATRQSVIDAMMARTNEDYAKSTDQSNSDLIARGIRPGTKAYGDQMQMIERSRNDARQQAEIAGGNMASQAYGLDADKRKQYIAELLAQRQTPVNEINALMSGSQIQNPFTQQYQGGGQVQAGNVAGATGLLGGYNTDIYNQGVASSNSNKAAAASIAAAMMMGSDRRLKSNIVRIGDHPLGIGIYSYTMFGKQDVGVMAQELLDVMPEAVVMLQNGYMAVNYGALGNGRD